MTTNPVTQWQSKEGRLADSVTPSTLPTLNRLGRTSWRTPVATAALALVLGLGAVDAFALALGRVNVLSALGEPLRAEIEVPEITAEEAASLRTAVASPDAFRAAGLEYNAALSSVQISLQRRANGTAFLRVTSDRTINEPFVDLILEASWASGRIVRDYTMLFDPANLRTAPAPVATVPAASTPSPAPATAPVTPRASGPASSSVATPATRPARTEKDKPAEKAGQAAPKEGVTVKSGDTAAALAARYQPAGVSLDQMLVAMLRASPDAFIGGNVNRLKSGAVLDMQAASGAAPNTPQADARRTIVAQSKDFNEFRRRLADGAPVASAAAPSRAAGGKVQANVNEPKAQATAPDKLTLSKGSVAAKGKEDAIAKDKQAKDNAARVAELSKNIQDLNKLGSAPAGKPGAPAAAPAAATASSGAGVKVAGSGQATVPAPTTSSPISVTSTAAKAATPTTTSTTIPSAATASSVASTSSSNTQTVAPGATATASDSATATSAANTSTAAASTATTATVAATPAQAAAPAAAPKAAPPPPPEPTFLESLMDNPLLIPGAGGLLAALGGLAFWRNRQKKKAVQVDSSFLESRLQPDSFFGASGGQRVDTADSGNGGGAGSSMVYSPSQLDAAGDVDPVAEADVYLAYGRDLQAEEILKEAMRTNPSRVAIHVKLMEIYAKRRDAKAFEAVAKEAFGLTQGAGPEWDAASALGRDIDPGNPMYQPGNAPAAIGLAGSVMTGGAAMAATAAFNATSTIPQQAMPASDADFDIDLDLDFSAGGDDLVAAPDNSGMIDAPMISEPTMSLRAQPMADPAVDFDMSEPAALDAIKLSEPDMALLNNSLNFSMDSSPAPMVSAPTAPMALKAGPSEPAALEFDLGGLSLDLLGSSNAAAASDAVDAGVSGDPLETKLALAMEFRDIGDSDGARSLVQEVADEASGALKTRALKMLADLG
ncbi:MAG: fimbrial protein FimV [Brachymonas sp.]|nr:fimbrial protein FimV [Brachymonas sp.]